MKRALQEAGIYIDDTTQKPDGILFYLKHMVRSTSKQHKYERTDISNPTYCAKFARGVAEYGGFDWDFNTLRGMANVEDVNEVNDSKIITIE